MRAGADDRRGSACLRAHERGIRSRRTRAGSAAKNSALCIASPGSASGNPQSQAGARLSAGGGEAMDGGGRQGMRGGRDEQQDQQAVVGAAAFRDRRDRQPGELRLQRHRPADRELHHRFQRIDDEARQHAGERDKAPRARPSLSAKTGRPPRADPPPASAAGRGRRRRRGARNRRRPAPLSARSSRRPSARAVSASIPETAARAARPAGSAIPTQSR